MERRLSAIFAADMVGYSRLIEADEIGTLERQKSHRKDLIDPTIQRLHGRIVKEMGDGILVEFGSVVAAVQCAVVIQKEMMEREAGTTSARRMQYRIGINLGDVVAENDDLYGDGINVAARLEQLADPGGLLISGTAYDHLRGKVDLQFQSIGERRLKNISQPVRIYRAVLDNNITMPALKSGVRSTRARSAVLFAAFGILVLLVGGSILWKHWEISPSPELTAQSDKIAIAVLPFTNASTNPKDAYFAVGMTEDLITDLTKFPDFQVAASTSTTAYRNNESNIREIGRELGVRYILEGSIEKGQEKIRVTAQLIDAKSGSHIWAERYDRSLTDVFVLRDEIRKAIIGAITGYTGPLLDAEIKRAAKLPASAVHARDLYYQAFAEFSKFEPAANERARELLKRTIALNPNDASVQALLAWTYFRDHWVGWTEDPIQAARLALQAGRQAVELDPSNYRARWSLGSAYRLVGNQRAVKENYERAFELNPNDPDLFADWGEVLSDNGQVEEAVAQLERAIQLNPRYPVWYARVLATCYFKLGRYEDSLRVEGKILKPDAFHRLLRIAAYLHIGQKPDAQSELDAVRNTEPNLNLSQILNKHLPQERDEKIRKRIESELRTAGLL